MDKINPIFVIKQMLENNSFEWIITDEGKAWMLANYQW